MSPAKNCPKIIQTDTDLEFYQSFGSLVVTDTKGEPLAMPDNVRLYYLASLQHAAAAERQVGHEPALHLSDQSALCRAGVAGAARRAGSMDRRRDARRRRAAIRAAPTARW